MYISTLEIVPRPSESFALLFAPGGSEAEIRPTGLGQEFIEELPVNILAHGSAHE